MALNKGKKQVFRKTIDTSVPYVPAKSYACIAFDNLEPTFKRIQADQEKTAQANYFFDFSMKTKEFFDQARIDNQFDANGMKQAVDSYSKNLLEIPFLSLYLVKSFYEGQTGKKLKNLEGQSTIS